MYDELDFNETESQEAYDNAHPLDNTLTPSYEPISPFELSPSEKAIMTAKTQQEATTQIAKIKSLKDQRTEIANTIQALQLESTKSKRDLEVAKRLQRVRKTPQEIIDAQEEAHATLEVEIDELTEQLTQLDTDINRAQNAANRARLISSLPDFNFDLGISTPSLSISLLSGLRRNLVYRQRYLEDTISGLYNRIRDNLETNAYANPMAGVATQVDQDRERLEDTLEPELAEVYALQQVTGLLYDKIADLIPENQQQMLKWSPKDPITIEQIRRQSFEREAERLEAQAIIAERRAAERTAAADRRIRNF